MKGSRAQFAANHLVCNRLNLCRVLVLIHFNIVQLNVGMCMFCPVVRLPSLPWEKPRLTNLTCYVCHV